MSSKKKATKFKKSLKLYYNLKCTVHVVQTMYNNKDVYVQVIQYFRVPPIGAVESMA